VWFDLEEGGESGAFYEVSKWVSIPATLPGSDIATLLSYCNKCGTAS
jgi:hypothetical protein